MSIIRYKWLILTVALLVIFEAVKSANLSEKQIKAAAKLIRNACQPKHKVSDEEIANMHSGIWKESPESKCYMFCVLVQTKVMKKNGTPDWKSAFVQADTLPPERVESSKLTMAHCRDTVEMGDDKCDNAWRISKCIYEHNPSNYVMP